MNHIPGPNKAGHWGLLMGYCCSSPGVSAQLLQLEVVQVHHFHRCWSPSSLGSAAARGGHSHKGKTKLGSFSAFWNNQSVLLLLILRGDSPEHNTGLCPWKCPWFMSSDCCMRYTHAHLVLAPSSRPEWPPWPAAIIALCSEEKWVRQLTRVAHHF